MLERHRERTMALASALRAVHEAAVDVVYPRRCGGCGRRGTWCCSDCDARLTRFEPPWCARCGVPSSAQCRCDRMPGNLQRVRSIGPFDGWLQGAIVGVKYHGEWSRVESLAQPLANVMADLMPFDAVVPVPLHPARMRRRGYNQSQLVAQQTARLLGVAVEEPLVRLRRTAPQVGLGSVARSMNVAGAFAVRPDSLVAARRFVLIDDVITTGSTLSACAEALLLAGAASVSVATLAREM